MLGYPSTVEVPVNRRPYARLKSELIGRNSSPAIPQASIAQFLSYPSSNAAPVVRKPVPTNNPDLPAFDPSMSQFQANAYKKKEIKESEIDRIDRAAKDFVSSDMNFIQMLAEASVFSAILFFQWASGITKPKRVFSFAKAILVLVFLVLHPIYCVVSMLVLSMVYAHWRLHQRVK